ncbi:hypothetical protein SAMN06265337_2125 [Hymenobacter gelipurpurascens]|uniref:Uncharacterized protein n=1 Tax=Hymenobacter gelipurpurascens TaxID=89968 RepID=A0A212TPL9_9BACT|nr:hypothetical protein SAMN06265337_2125 [Hymenobacter gelipurpurascens]
MLLVRWCHNRFSSSRDKRFLQQREPFLGLKQLGFQIIDEAYTGHEDRPDTIIPAFIGLVNNYSVEISFNWITGWSQLPHYRVRVFFEPGSRDTAAIKHQVDYKLDQSKLFRWQEDWLLKPVYAENKVFIGRFYRPNSQCIVEAAVELIKELQRLDLSPIEYEVGIGLSVKQKETSDMN